MTAVILLAQFSQENIPHYQKINSVRYLTIRKKKERWEKLAKVPQWYESNFFFTCTHTGFRIEICSLALQIT